MPPAVRVACHCPKCNGTLVSVRTERSHRNGPISRQQNLRPAAGRKDKRAITGPTVDHSLDSTLEEPVPHSGINKDNALEDGLNEMHGDEVPANNNVDNIVSLLNLRTEFHAYHFAY